MLKKQYSKTKPSCKVTFSIPLEAVETATDIRVLGDFNNWSWEEGLVMKKSKSEYKATAELAAGQTYEFRYLVDQSTWMNDHSADAYVPSPFHGIDNSVITLDVVDIKPAAPKKKPAKKAAPKKVAPKKAAPKKVAKDDLKKIEGIGPKIAQLLNAGGIETFEGLAKAKKTTLKKILEEAGPRFKMHDPTTWANQAKLAAKGDWDKLAKLQDELKGGRAKK